MSHTPSMPASARPERSMARVITTPKALFALAITFATAITAYALINESIAGMKEYVYTYFFITYEFEFIKRGFIGEIIRLLSIPLSNFSASAIYILGFAACWIVFVGAFIRMYVLKPTLDVSLLLLFFAFCPALSLHFATQDFGRLDIFLVMLLLFSVVSPFYISKWPSLLFIIGCQIAACLIHEGALLLTAPMAFFIWSMRVDGKYPLIPASAAFCVVTLATMVIWYYGDITEMTLDDIYEVYASRSVDGSPLFKGAINILMSGLDSAMGTLFYSVPLTLVHHAVFLVAVFFHLVFLINVARAADFVGPVARYGSILFILTPLALYPLGHDFFRWWSFVFLNAFVLIAYLWITSDKFRSFFANVTRANRMILILGIVFSLLVGGTGNKNSLSPEYMPILIATGLAPS